jgi:cupin fold WbuC family metalloprotein
LKEKSSKIGIEHFDFLKEILDAQKLERARICVHHDDHDSIHEMFVALSSKGYVRPHCHVGKAESGFAVEGKAIIVFFDSDGNVTDHFLCAPQGENSVAYYHIQAGKIHTQLVLTDIFIFHEVLPGPFDQNSSFFPEWAPRGGEAAAFWLRHTLKEVYEQYE